MRCKGFSFYHQSLGRLQNSQSALNAPPPWPVPGAQAHAAGWGPRGTPRMRAGQQNRGLKDILWRATLQTSITIVTSGKIRILLAFLTLIGGGGRFSGGANGKEPACRCWRHKRHRFDPWVRKILWGRVWQPTPVFLPGEPHGQRILDYSP